MSDVRTTEPGPTGREEPFGEDGRAPAGELVDVRKYFDGGIIKALNGLSPRVERGESVAVTGPSGCGKSTMLHLIAASTAPPPGSSGSVAWTLPQRRTFPVTAAAISAWFSSCTTCSPS